MLKETIFDRIARKEIPADIVYEDDLAIAFKDINPQGPVHIVLIPKNKCIPTLNDIKEKDKPLLGHLMSCIPTIAKQQKIDKEGFRVVSNCEEWGGQTVYYLHIHIIGGRKMNWPPG